MNVGARSAARVSCRVALRRSAFVEPLEGRRLLTTVVVNTDQDAIFAGSGTSSISLRDAINTANTSTTPTKITFDPTVFSTLKTITLSNEGFVITNKMSATTITGPAGGLLIHSSDLSNTSSRNAAIFKIDQQATASLSGMGLTGLNSFGNGGSGQSAVDNNGGNLTMTGMAVYDNAGGAAGGLGNYLGGTVNLYNCTFYHNTSSGRTQSIVNASTLNVRNCSIFSLGVPEPFPEIEVYAGGTMNIANTIVKNYGFDGAYSDVVASSLNGQSGIVNSLGHNLIGQADASVGWGSTDLTGTVASPYPAGVDLLKPSGGNGPYHIRPIAGNPAINGGSNALVPAGLTTDGIGNPRVSGGTVDIGAIEVQQPTPVFVEGIVYDDNDRSGSQGIDEVGVGGRQMYDDLNQNGQLDPGEPAAVTNAFGGYSFQVPPNSTAYVRQLQGYQDFSSFNPMGNAVYEVHVGAKNVLDINFADAPRLPTTIKGRVYNDTNGNGRPDTGEAGLPYVTIYSDTNNDGAYEAGELATITDTAGNYSLAVPGHDTIVIRQIVHFPAFTQTEPSGGGPHTEYPDLTTVPDQNFGDRPAAHIPSDLFSGTVYNDANDNGKKDSNESGLAGITVYDDVNNNGRLDLDEPATVTDGVGAFTVTVAGTGTGILRVLRRSNQTQTAPANGTGIHVTLAGTTTQSGLLFGLYTPPGMIAAPATLLLGSVFNDVNKNAVLDSGEAGLANVTVYVDANKNGRFDTGERSATTQADGSYGLSATGNGLAVIREVVPHGDNQTLPAGGAGLQVTLAGGIQAGLNFGDSSFLVVPSYTFTGTVYNDANRNLRQGNGERGLAGWEVYDDANNNGELDAHEAVSFAGATGAYAITLTGTGTAKLREIVPANWSQTTPTNNYGLTVTLSPGSAKTGFNFGDYTASTYRSTVATTPGLAAWFTFDGTADSVVNGYAGTLKGGATIAPTGGAPVAGGSGNSGLSLDGTSAYVDTNLTTQQTFTTAGTYNVWIDLGPTPAASGHIYTILAKSQAGNDLDLQIETDGKLHFYTDTGSSTSFTPTSLTGWHMVTATFDTAAKVRSLYWDGRLAATTSPLAAGHAASTGTFSIGASDVFGGRNFGGKLDEVSLWNRALTADEVLAIFDAAAGT